MATIASFRVELGPSWCRGSSIPLGIVPMSALNGATLVVCEGREFSANWAIGNQPAQSFCCSLQKILR
jgi:hypothetical protein